MSVTVNIHQPTGVKVDYLYKTPERESDRGVVCIEFLNSDNNVCVFVDHADLAQLALAFEQFRAESPEDRAVIATRDLHGPRGRV